MKKNIGIIVLATNSYLILGIRFVKKFLHHYKGDSDITFYFFSDKDPRPYLPNVDVEYFFAENKNWADGTNLKFKSILSIGDRLKSDYLFYFDADTNVTRNFTEEWFLGDMVGGQHYADQIKGWMLERKGFDSNPESKAYVPDSSTLPRMYFYGAFFGGSAKRMIEFCELMRFYQVEDKKIPYEPGCNDESYINREFHFNPPSKIVLCTEFMFDISDKGGIGETRRMDLDISDKLERAMELRDKVWDIRSNVIVEV